MRHRWMDNLWVPLYFLNQAELLMECGRHEQAFPVLTECEALFAELQQRFVEPELHRVRAVALHARGADPASIDASFDLAMQAAIRQGTRLFELRAATSRAQVWQLWGRSEQARALLEPIFAEFTEGLQCPDLRQAQELLARL
jgi:hypothetical protein